MKTYSLIIAMLFCMYTSYAGTYTATSSGNFSSSATWSGGTIPPATPGANDIINIPGGISVTLDINLTLKKSTLLNIEGMLKGAPGIYIEDNSALLNTMGAGTGVIEVDSFSTASSSALWFNGSIIADKFSASNITLDLINAVQYLQVNDKLYITGGTLTIAGGTIKFPVAGEVIIDGGNMNIAPGGKIETLNRWFKIMYTGSSTQTGMELSQKVYDIDINVGVSNKVTLTNNLATVDSTTITIYSGVLDLNNFGLSTSNIKIPNPAIAAIRSTSASGIALQGKITDTSQLQFAQGGDTLFNFTYSPSTGSHNPFLTLINSNLYIKNTFNIGGRMDIQSNTVSTLPGAPPFIFVSPNEDSYVITSNGGSLSMYLQAGQTSEFPVGTDKYKAPLTILPSSKFPDMLVSVSMKSGVQQDGNSGSSVSATQPVVDATWNLTSTVTNGLNLDIMVGWNKAMEVNNFDRTQAYISHYDGTQWDSTLPAPCSYNKDVNVYQKTRNGITSLSPFSVFDKNTAVYIKDMVADIKNVSMYPNPTSDNVFVSIDVTKAQPLTLSVTDLAGRLIYKGAPVLYSAGRTNIQVPVAKLSTGTYMVSLSNNDQRIWTKQLIRN